MAHLPQDTEVNHAWVEAGDTVHEVSNGQNVRMEKHRYYGLYRLEGKTYVVENGDIMHVPANT